jgi:Tfp pilus assembly ATPase PilU
LVLEIMKTNSDVKALITGTQDQERMWSMREILEINNELQGTQSLDQCLVSLFKEGRISEDTLMFNSPDPDALLYRQSKLGVKLSVKWDPTGAELDQAINFMDSSLLAEKERLEAEKAKKKKGWDPLDDLNFNFNT